MREKKRQVAEPDELAALAHPLRLDLIIRLMAAGPGTASECARAVGDSPSNCSYHLRVLQSCGLVEAVDSADGRERPWRATITGFGVDTDRASAEQVGAIAMLNLQRDQRLSRDYFGQRAGADARWQAAAGHATYTLLMTPKDLASLGERLDGLIRPYLAATREGPPRGSELVHVGLHAFPLPPART